MWMEKMPEFIKRRLFVYLSTWFESALTWYLRANKEQDTTSRSNEDATIKENKIDNKEEFGGRVREARKETKKGIWYEKTHRMDRCGESGRGETTEGWNFRKQASRHYIYTSTRPIIEHNVLLLITLWSYQDTYNNIIYIVENDRSKLNDL